MSIQIVVSPFAKRRAAPARVAFGGLLAGVVLALTAAGEAQEGGGPPPARVATARVTRGAVYDDVQLTGTVRPRRFSRLSAEVDGLVEERLVEEGDFVTTGQLMLRLRSRPAALRLEQMEMMLQLEHAQLEEMQNGTRAEDVEVSAAEVQEARARVALAQAEADRLARLLATNVASQSDYDRAKAELDRAGAELARKSAEYDRAVKGPREEAIAQSAARAAAAAADVARMQDDLERHDLRAPYAGVIGTKSVDVGQWVATGDELFAMAEIDVLHVQVEVPEKYFNNIHLGDTVLVSFDSLGEDSEPIEAPVVVKIPLADTSSRAFPIRLEVRNVGYRLAPGMFARAALRISSQKGESLLVPKDAVVHNADKTQQVWVVRESPDKPGQKMAMPETVRSGRPFLGFVEIKDGNLAEGDEVVVRGNERLIPTQPVIVGNPGGEEAAQPGA